MTSKTVTSKFTEIISEGRKFHLKFIDSDMSFELIEFVKTKVWYKSKPIEKPTTVYTGNGDMYRAIALHILIGMDGALKERKEALDKELTGNRSFIHILEVAEQIKLNP